MEVEYKNIDPKLIVNEIRNGRSIEAVQKLFGLRFKSEVQDLYMRGLMELGEIPPLDFGKKRGTLVQNPTPGSQLSSTARGSVEARHPVTIEDTDEFVSQDRVHKDESKDLKIERPVIIRKKEKKPSLFVKTDNFRTIGQSGSITLNKALLIDQLGFSVGDTFEIYREDDRIVLQKTEAFGK